MKNKEKKILSILLVIIWGILITFNTYGHSGRTDSYGGHRDNQNKSGLGSYHYHCGGHPAHLHPNGVCPYSYSSKNSLSTKKKSSTKKTTKKAKSIKINNKISTINVGKSKTLKVTIYPSNTTNKKVTWKSSNSNIITVNKYGKITAKSTGTAKITASTSNKKTATLKIKVIKEKKNKIKTKTKTNGKNDTNFISTSEIKKTNVNNIKNTNNSNNSDDSNIGVGIVVLGAIGGASYWIYNKKKKNINNEK